MADIIDQAQAMEARNLEAAHAERLRLLELEREDQLIENGEVVCLDCKVPISAARLAVIPHASRCVACQDAKDVSRA